MHVKYTHKSVGGFIIIISFLNVTLYDDIGGYEMWVQLVYTKYTYFTSPSSRNRSPLRDDVIGMIVQIRKCVYLKVFVCPGTWQKRHLSVMLIHISGNATVYSYWCMTSMPHVW